MQRQVLRPIARKLNPAPERSAGMVNTPEPTDAEIAAIYMTRLEEWVHMCCGTPEFVCGYNRLRGTNLSFELPRRTPIEAMVDQACGHVPTLANKPDEQQEFFGHCTELFDRLVQSGLRKDG